MEIYKNSYFERFAQRNKISDLDLTKAVERINKGLIDADLGGSLIKQRIARKGQSRSRGYRTILVCVKESRYFFIYGYAKSDKDNLTNSEMREFKKLAQIFSTLSDKQLKELLKQKSLIEVKTDGQKI